MSNGCSKCQGLRVRLRQQQARIEELESERERMKREHKAQERITRARFDAQARMISHAATAEINLVRRAWREGLRWFRWIPKPLRPKWAREGK